jgi:hypothetical protein
MELVPMWAIRKAFGLTLLQVHMLLGSIDERCGGKAGEDVVRRIVSPWMGYLRNWDGELNRHRIVGFAKCFHRSMQDPFERMMFEMNCYLNDPFGTETVNGVLGLLETEPWEDPGFINVFAGFVRDGAEVRLDALADVIPGLEVVLGRKLVLPDPWERLLRQSGETSSLPGDASAPPGSGDARQEGTADTDPLSPTAGKVENYAVPADDLREQCRFWHDLAEGSAQPQRRLAGTCSMLCNEDVEIPARWTRAREIADTKLDTDGDTRRRRDGETSAQHAARLASADINWLNCRNGWKFLRPQIEDLCRTKSMPLPPWPGGK